MQITSYQAEMAHAIADLFYQAVHAIDPSFYSLEQQAVWAPAPINYSYWQQRLAQTQPRVALCNQQIAGFIELDSTGYIDCLYVHPAFQRQHVATTLLADLEQRARAQGIEQLSVDASLLAQPFFERHGYKFVRSNLIERSGQQLRNTRLSKTLLAHD